MQEKLAILLSRKLSGEATPDELSALEKWIRDNPQDHYVIEAVQLYWHNTAAQDFFNISDNAHFERMLNKAETPVVAMQAPQKLSKYKPVWLKWAAAAVFVGCMISGAVIFNQHAHQGETTAKDDIVTTRGTKSKIILPDGTKVWLNADTRLHFDKEFNGVLREVYLDGEAFFDVTKDKNRPFIVHTSDIDIRVLGTAFNVKSYKEEATIEATLIHGSIQVTRQKECIPKIILSPHEKLVFNKLVGKTPESPDHLLPVKEKDPQYLVSKILQNTNNDSSIVETAWVHNRLLFDGDTFKQLAVKMERWFDVQIKFENAEVANYRLRGAFEDETIGEALKALQQIAHFKFTIRDKTVTIAK
jgi:ferric-dicitrate binding protein FerR (iron transport regulator)